MKDFIAKDCDQINVAAMGVLALFTAQPLRFENQMSIKKSKV